MDLKYEDMSGSIVFSGFLCSMWRLICLAFFGAFAWGMAWETYGARISEHTAKFISAVKVHMSPKTPVKLLRTFPDRRWRCGGGSGH